MVISVTPMVCITLAFWLGRIGLTCSGGCCADANGAAQISANRIAKVKRENRFREIMVVLLRFWNLAHYVSRSGCTASATVSTGSDSDRVSINAKRRDCRNPYPVAIAPGTDLKVWATYIFPAFMSARAF